MTHPIALIEQTLLNKLLRHYNKEYLRNLILNEPFVPISLPPGANKPENTRELHEAIEQYLKHQKSATKKGWEIEWKDLGSIRKFNKQDWPRKIIIPTEEDYVNLLKKQREVVQFKKQLTVLLSWNEGIRGWLATKPSNVLKYERDWMQICSCIETILNTDISQYYIRSLPVNAHSKFIEQNDNLLLSILKHIDPVRFTPEITSLKPLFKQFPQFNLIRWLDQNLADQYSQGKIDNSVSMENLREEHLRVKEIWLVENKTNLYNLPQRPSTLAIFSQGFALARFENIRWWKDVKLRYWGDLDVAGFRMLHQLREMYPHAESMLMDITTVESHQSVMRQIEKVALPLDLQLQPYEEKAFQLIQPDQRIEQEQLDDNYLQQFFTNLK